jgi:hypothetical protein
MSSFAEERDYGMFALHESQPDFLQFPAEGIFIRLLAVQLGNDALASGQSRKVVSHNFVLGPLDIHNQGKVRKLEVLHNTGQSRCSQSHTFTVAPYPARYMLATGDERDIGASVGYSCLNRLPTCCGVYATDVFFD